MNGYLSGTFVAKCLKRTYPCAGRTNLNHTYLFLLQMGFTKPPHHCDAGALLPHLFSFSPCCQGEFPFLWHYPSRHRALYLTGILSCGAPTFLTSIQVCMRSRLAYSHRLLYLMAGLLHEISECGYLSLKIFRAVSQVEVALFVDEASGARDGKARDVHNLGVKKRENNHKMVLCH